MAWRAHLGLALVIAGVASLAGGGGGCTCSKGGDASAADAASADEASPETRATVASVAGGLSAPIAGARGDQGDVVVAGLDVAASAVRVQRINAKDEVVGDRTIFDGVKWSSESELKVVPAAGGVGVTWRGLRGGKLVRQLLVLGADLAPKGDATEVAAASCATKDALWYTDGKRVHARPWSGSPTRSELPKDKDAALVCGVHRAFALLDEDDGTSVVILGGGEGDAGATTSSPTKLLKESEFGDDDQRERSEYTVGDDVGVVRLGVSGAVTLREVKSGAPGPIRKLKTMIPRDDDVVAVDASPRAVVIVFTEDVSDACPKDAGAAGSTGTASTRVKALRVDRTTFEESTVELSPGMCGREVGPFFTGAIGDGVSVAWVERVPVAGKARAPVAGLAHRLVPPSGAPAELARIDQPADALVDAGCDGTRCYAVALARKTGMDAMVPGLARVLRY
ncbi:MAG: hypothetical protein JWP87_859 [Labilithrix sp.]|nr:hypothetical protein [Labilithrix sp.]